MRRLTVPGIVLAALLCAPALAHAGSFGRKGSSSSNTSNSSSNSHPSAPVGTPHAATPGSGGYSPGTYRSGYGTTYYAPGYYYGPSYYAWGVHPWGYYGYGYYPYYGAPMVAESYGAPRGPPEVTGNVFLGGLFTRDGAGLSLHAGFDARRWGANFDLITLPSVNPSNTAEVNVVPLVKGHITYALLSDLHARLRLEGGIAGVSAPDVTYIGPSAGLTGQLALVGPLALEAGAHWMPVPVSIVDLDASLGLNFGALAFKGGWRWLRLDDRRVNSTGGVDLYNGPQVSVGLLF